jgi:hypothetical protein
MRRGLRGGVRDEERLACKGNTFEVDALVDFITNSTELFQEHIRPMTL